ncbi:uncharacterized protein N7482_005981 [Penicillium canariense]|uniref:GAT domain-containing protein n=1 Tax=Penicillium canariense TaxID=189055 RepID=A0A9W9LNP7_9EURO|nr:uncharacterized protein N7482_005981 [Penicillium canariense]KAJ5167200.1 hypothetical protein N7482_005981 [Penicillium canariense]
MKGFLRSFGSRRSSPSDGDGEQDHADDSPEAILLREMKTFCEASSAPQTQDVNHLSCPLQQGNEFVHLPRIVETAESSPAAAKEAAHRIRKYLSNPGSTPNHVQYNAIMLMRILADNPGHTFTRNFDSKFCTTIKELLRHGRDWHVQHYLRQYLAQLEANRHWDEDLQLLLQMWAKEKTKGERSFVDRYPTASATQQYSPMAPYPVPHRMGQSAPNRTLPEPGELAARVEEAKNSAKLLMQFVQTTPQAELEENELIKEFIDRCRTSSRFLQGYIHSTNPAPDEETLLTLIETNDEISVALSQQQRAMLKARKARGSSTPASNVNSPSPSSSEAVASGGAGASPAAPEPISPAAPTPRESRSPEQQSTPVHELSSAMSTGRPTASRTTTEQYEYNSTDFEVQNPFADDFATGDSNVERNGQHATPTDTSTAGRVRFQPTE